MPTFSVAELARHVSGAVEGDDTLRIRGVAPVGDAGPGQLTFVTNDRYRRLLEASDPSAALVPEQMEIGGGGHEGVTLIRVPDPQLAFTKLAALFDPSVPPAPGVDPSAHLGRGVQLGAGVSVGAHARIGDGVQIGDRTIVGPFAVVEREAAIGADCLLAHGCSVLERVKLGDRVRLHPGARIGTDGFGYTRGPDGAVKVPQLGGCVLGDDVEVGANTTIDRGSLGDTTVGARTKIDNLVHVGHNVEIGEDCMIVAQVGIAGSVRIGPGAALAGQAGIAGHLTIGAGARIGAQAGVIGDVPAGASYSGYPARPHGAALRASAAAFRLPRILARLRAVEEHLGLGRRSTPEGSGPGGTDAHAPKAKQADRQEGADSR